MLTRFLLVAQDSAINHPHGATIYPHPDHFDGWHARLALVRRAVAIYRQYKDRSNRADYWRAATVFECNQSSQGAPNCDFETGASLAKWVQILPIVRRPPNSLWHSCQTPTGFDPIRFARFQIGFLRLSPRPEALIRLKYRKTITRKAMHYARNGSPIPPFSSSQRVRPSHRFLDRHPYSPIVAK